MDAAKRLESMQKLATAYATYHAAPEKPLCVGDLVVPKENFDTLTDYKYAVVLQVFPPMLLGEGKAGASRFASKDFRYSVDILLGFFDNDDMVHSPMENSSVLSSVTDSEMDELETRQKQAAEEAKATSKTDSNEIQAKLEEEVGANMVEIGSAAKDVIAPPVFVTMSERLKKLYTIYSSPALRAAFQPGDLISWKNGLRVGQKTPVPGGVGVVMEVLPRPLFSVLGLCDIKVGCEKKGSGPMLQFHFDSNLFEKIGTAVDGVAVPTGGNFASADRVSDSVGRQLLGNDNATPSNGRMEE